MEQELKFALPALPLAQLRRQLAQLPLLAGKRPQRLRLHNTYYDTPQYSLQAQRVALRVRQLGTPTHPTWVQTLKTAGTSLSALSQRGEWEAPLPSAQLSADLMRATPWAELDPKGALFQALRPVFTTTFERLRWTLLLPNASVELALDHGSVLVNGRSTPLYELEIELLSGTPDALFEVATRIGEHLCLLPLHISKAERAFRLAQGTLQEPLHARAPDVHKAQDFATLARRVLRASLLQFTANLYTLRSSAEPEVLHQARVGWRRFRSALKLFAQHHTQGMPAALAALQPLRQQMALLRDLDVLATELLPPYAQAYQGDSAQRATQWQHLQAALQQERLAQRAELLQRLAKPAVGQALLHLIGWLEVGAAAPPTPLDAPGAAAAWVARRVAKLGHGLDRALAGAELADMPQAQQHQLRMLAKRLRYSVEDLHPLLPVKRAKAWQHSATALQEQVGRQRDLQQAIGTVRRLQAASELIGFLRGAAFAASQTPTA
jgi:inorganic triphosphatase YgiF